MNLQSSVNATNAPALKLETNVQDNTTSPNLETCLNDKASPLDTCSPVTATNPEFKKIIKTDSSHSANYKDELILLEDIEKLTGALQQHRLSKSTNNPIDILKSRASVSSKKSSLPRIPHNVTQTSGSLKRDGSSRKSSQAEMIEDKRESILDEKARKRASHQGKIYNSSNYSNYRSVPNISKIPASDNQPNADVSRVSSTSRNAIEKPTIHVYPRFEIRVSSSHNSIHNSNERKLSLSGSVDRSDSIFETNISDDGSNAKAQQIASDMFKPRVARPPTTIEENELLQIKIPHSSEPIQETNSPSPKMASSFQSTNSPQSPTAVQLGFANNQEYYEYLMLSQRHVSTNFIHSLGSGDVFYNEKVMHKFIGPFLLGGEIGHGAFGKVKEGICTQTLQRVAVKIINRKRVKKVPNGIEKVLREIKLLKRLKHKNVVTLIEVYAKVEDENENQGIFNWFSTIEDEPISWPREDGTSEECYVKVLKWYLVFEYCPCTLQTVVDFEKGIKDTSVACRYFNQLAVGLEYIHSQNRDIKPGNILLTTDGIVKFSDFGIAEQFDLYNQDDMISSEFAGTHQFLPPEIAEGQSSFEATGVDIWALGVTLYNMLTGNYPFEFSTEKNILELYDKIINGEYEMPINIDEEGRSLISGMLEKNYEKRSNIFQIINHPWTKSIQHENPRSSTVSVPMNDTSDEKTRMMPIIETLFSQELSEFYNVDGTLEAQFRKQDNYLDGLPIKKKKNNSIKKVFRKIGKSLSEFDHSSITSEDSSGSTAGTKREKKKMGL